MACEEGLYRKLFPYVGIARVHDEFLQNEILQPKDGVSLKEYYILKL